MGVLDGQQISASITNAAFLNKNQADQMTFPVSFTKTLSLSKRNESSGATLNAMDSSQSLVNITGTVTTINGATAPASYADGATLIIANSSASTVTVSHESGSATAANRFSLSGGAPLLISPGLAAQFFYNTTDSRWHQMAGVGSGSGSGLKNYITYSDFEGTGTTGWSLAASTLDATTKLPNQASGSWTAAAATLSFTTVGSGSQLAGDTSGSLVSSAATTAGNMLVTDALTLDLEAQASIQTWSFFYKIASGASNGNFSGTSSNSIGVAIYDVTNSAWIQPAGVFNIVQSSLVGKAAGTFQVPSNCTSVRLAIYFPNATTGAITVYIDDVVLGPQVVQYGAPVSDWESYSCTVQGSASNPTVSVNAFKRRVGDSLQVSIVTGAFTADGSGYYTFPLPSGLSIDTSKGITLATGLTDSSGGWSGTLGSVVGQAAIKASAAFKFGSAEVVVATTTSVAVGINLQSSTGTTNIDIIDIFGSANAPTASGGNTSLTFTVPIVGWSSSVQVSNDTDTRVVAARASGDPASATSGNPIIFPTTAFDTHGAYNASTGRYTVAVSGFYKVHGAIVPGTGGALGLFAYVNGVSVVRAGNTDANTAGVFTALLQVNTGDLIDLRPNATLDAGNGSVINFERLSGPSVIAANESVVAKYNLAAQVTSSSTAPINYATKVYDSHGAVTTGASWKFTAPISGKYRLDLVGASSTSLVGVDLYVNGSNLVTIGHQVNDRITSSGTSVSLVAGDYIDARYNSSQTTLATSLTSQAIMIARIGN